METNLVSFAMMILVGPVCKRLRITPAKAKHDIIPKPGGETSRYVELFVPYRMIRSDNSFAMSLLACRQQKNKLKSKTHAIDC